MSHQRLKIIGVHRTGTLPISFPANSAVKAVTTVSNGPALLLEAEGAFFTDVSVYNISVFDLGLGDILDAGADLPDASEFLGVATNGQRCWAVFKSSVPDPVNLFSRVV